MAKNKVSEKAMNEVVKFVAQHQNDKKKLNAGQIREMIRLVFIGLAHHLDHNQFKPLAEMISADPLTVKIIKDKKIAALEKQLADAKK